MNGTILKTDRLELVGSTAEMLRAEGDDRARFAELLGARVPADWPPELYDDDARLWTLDKVETQPQHEGWWTYYVIHLGEGGREVAGLAGYKGPPTDDGTVEVGYAVMPAHRRRGYATEAVAALVERAFADPRVTRVIAETLPELAPSIGVLEKSGFAFIGEGSEEGVIRYELPRARWEAR
jgi:[ribosomal protein S5]-alanine N-acetyltransferase